MFFHAINSHLMANKMAAVIASCETLLQTNIKSLVLQMSAGLFFTRLAAVIVLLLFHMLQSRKVRVNCFAWTTHKCQHRHSLTTKAQLNPGEETLLHRLNWVLRCVIVVACLCGITSTLDVVQVPIHLTCLRGAVGPEWGHSTWRCGRGGEVDLVWEAAGPARGMWLSLECGETAAGPGGLWCAPSD